MFENHCRQFRRGGQRGGGGVGGCLSLGLSRIPYHGRTNTSNWRRREIIRGAFNFLIASLTALIISMAIIPVRILFSPNRGMVDLLDPRKMHAFPISRVDGTGIALESLALVLLWIRTITRWRPIFRVACAARARALIFGHVASQSSPEQQYTKRRVAYTYTYKCSSEAGIYD